MAINCLAINRLPKFDPAWRLSWAEPSLHSHLIKVHVPAFCNICGDPLTLIFRHYSFNFVVRLSYCLIAMFSNSETTKQKQHLSISLFDTF